MNKVIFSKFSYERLADFQTMTVIFRDNDSLNVKKQALSLRSKPHILSFAHKYDILRSYYSGKLSAAPCRIDENDCAVFPMAEGKSMESILKKLFDEKNVQKAVELIRDFFEQIRAISTEMPVRSDKFSEIFGKPQLPEKMTAMSPANVDMSFDNVFLSDSGSYTVIDYEWTFDFPVPSEFIMYRALFHSVTISALNDGIKEQIYSLLNADTSRLNAFYNMELNFQNYVYGKGRVMGEMYAQYGKPAYHIGQPSDAALNNDVRKAYETEAAERLASQNRAKELFDAYNIESRAREEAQKQAEKFRIAYNTESRAREEAQKQAEEYRIAYNTESRAREEAQKQAEEFRIAYNTESRAREEAQKQAEEFRIASENGGRVKKNPKEQIELKRK